MTDKELIVRGVAMSLYTTGLSSFESLSYDAQQHWIEKIGMNAKELIDSEINTNKTNKKWCNEALKFKDKYMQNRII